MNPQIIIIIAALVMMFIVAWKYKIIPFGMTLLSTDRSWEEREGRDFSRLVKDAVLIYEGAFVVLDSSGYAKPGVTATGLVADGIALEQADNSLGAAGAIRVKVRKGNFVFANSSSSDEITKAEIGDMCYIVDDATVAKTSGGGTRSAAGTIVDVEDDGVWVSVGTAVVISAGLLAANNLSEVTAATARANIGANKVVVSLRATNLVGSGAVLYGIVSPVAGTITKIWSVLKGHALATGDATLTGKINGTAITAGAITITQSGSAIGDIDSATPSALKTVAAGDEIQFLVGGTNDNAVAFAEVSMLIET
jgi:hypothetical protein